MTPRKPSLHLLVAVLGLGLLLLACGASGSRPSPGPSAAVAPTPLIVVTDASITLDGVAVGDPRSIDATGRMKRIDELFNRLKERKEAYATAHPGAAAPSGQWLDLRPGASTLGAASALLTGAFAGYLAVHIKTPEGWLEARYSLPVPAGATPGVVHTRLAALLDADGVAVTWQSDKACDAVPQDARLSKGGLDAYLEKACASAGGRCFDVASLSVESKGAPADIVDALRALRRHDAGPFSFSLSVHGGDKGGEGAPRHFCGQPREMSGGLSSEQVRKVVMSHTGALRACYESVARTNLELRGGVTIAWQIDESGSVTSASVAQTTLNNPPVEGCILRQVRSWTFPPSIAPTTIAGFPFRFGVGDGAPSDGGVGEAP
jgi:hypothetical protein